MVQVGRYGVYAVFHFLAAKWNCPDYGMKFMLTDHFKAGPIYNALGKHYMDT